LSSAPTAFAKEPGPIAAHRPACKCGGGAFEWNRCACGEIFAVCIDCGPPGAARTARTEHERTCKVAADRWKRQVPIPAVRSGDPVV
jgi:hypothetical protein